MNRLISGIIVLGLLAPVSSRASCRQVSAKSVIAKSDVVFSGIVTARISPPNTSNTEFLRRFPEYHFSVGQVWKGAITDTLVLYNWYEDMECMCRRFEMGEDYLVYAFEIAGDVIAACRGRVGPVEDALLDRYVLGEPTVIRPELATAPVTAMDLIKALDSPDRRLSSRVSLELVEVIEDRTWLVEQLGMILRDRDCRHVGRAFQVIRALRKNAQDLVPEVSACTSNEDPRTREAAFETISSIVGPESYLPYLWAAFQDTSSTIRKRAWEWVGYSYHRLRPALQENLFAGLVVRMQEEPDIRARCGAIDALSGLWHFGERLRTLLEEIKASDPEEEVRDAARRALERLDFRLDGAR